MSGISVAPPKRTRAATSTIPAAPPRPLPSRIRRSDVANYELQRTKTEDNQDDCDDAERSHRHAQDKGENTPKIPNPSANHSEAKRGGDESSDGERVSNEDGGRDDDDEDDEDDEEDDDGDGGTNSSDVERDENREGERERMEVGEHSSSVHGKRAESDHDGERDHGGHGTDHTGVVHNRDDDDVGGGSKHGRERDDRGSEYGRERERDDDDVGGNSERGRERDDDDVGGGSEHGQERHDDDDEKHGSQRHEYDDDGEHDNEHDSDVCFHFFYVFMFLFLLLPKPIDLESEFPTILPHQLVDMICCVLNYKLIFIDIVTPQKPKRRTYDDVDVTPTKPSHGKRQRLGKSSNRGQQSVSRGTSTASTATTDSSHSVASWASGPPSSVVSDVIELQGASRTSGGHIRGKAVGNVFNMADSGKCIDT
jgi:hypothetical protein